jgi:hypothetical protein
MEWYYYLSGFFAGAFLSNAVPHFVHGISGNKFPTPFSTPGGIGLSSSTTNVLWALFNMVVGYFLLTAGPLNMPVFLAGIAVISIMSSIHFQRKHKED